ncbi:MAG: UvrD-helicase domain-containing protein [Clostridiales Family XIII bacterium]|jgi:DNA helicase-2/ATP-dependent DNA helicase PcrA|nr:UvrD-helicase domain-containing protein [Clostridiales Family XIII bacterium]
MDYLEKLNDRQREAATHKDGPLLILAGAGSGKTSTMTHRIAWLVREEGVAPYNILAVTFTNKAAGEMRERIEALIGSGMNMWILTFHSACLRILRKHATSLGYETGFVIYDPSDQKVVMKTLLKEQGVADKKFTPAYVLGVISDCKEKGKDAKTFEAESENSPTGRIIAPLFKGYERVLKKNNAMDFDDLILNTVTIFENDRDILKSYQERFRYIMVDEYQDTNSMQYRFIRLLAKAHNNICVVGDDDQCIYQWRGADIRNILDFEADFRGSKVIKLEQNYRSYGNIIEGAHSVIEKNKSRKAKKLWTDKEKGEKISYHRAENEKREAEYIADQIIASLGNNYSYKDIAILYRTNAQSRTFEEALSGHGLPYRVMGGVRYYERKEIKDMLAYMRLVQNPADDLAFARIINEPKRGVGGKTLEKMAALAAVRNESLFETASDDDVISGMPSKSGAAVKEMIELIAKIADSKDDLRVSDIYDMLMVRTGYVGALQEQNNVEAEGRIENLLEFKSVILEYEAQDSQLSIADFLEKITLIADVDNHDPNEDAVTLMTLHSAKGLEFPLVFMPGMEDGLFPGWRSLEKPDGIEEERRLCYVGMTRAMRKLYMTGAQVRTIYGKTDYTRESCFLRELDREYLEGDAPQGQKSGVFHPAQTGNDGFASKSVFKPFDQLKYIKQSMEVPEMVGDGRMLVNGDRVNHRKFGDGMVLESDEKTITVMFDGVGKKKLARDIAPITRIV